MNHQDHVRLLRKGVATPGGIWADLGCRTGAFTLALADLLGPTGSIYAVDKDSGALDMLQRTMQTSFPATTLSALRGDFTHPLELPMLDGIVMANALHFVRKKDALLQQVHSYLHPGRRLLLVEYNVDQGNPWVPYPLAYSTWERLTTRVSWNVCQAVSYVRSMLPLVLRHRHYLKRRGMVEDAPSPTPLMLKHVRKQEQDAKPAIFRFWLAIVALAVVNSANVKHFSARNAGNRREC